ncbi:MAG: tRNA lysidine(34) synthetase TilS [Pelagibacterium sp. SCN 64-44]|nr:MAG: tRNA lysidine(34) synthetase TilS [Pelagibacterium sp. SCN 64-44]
MSARLTPDLDSAEGLDGLFADVAGAKTIALAVSGGADSLALMLLAGRWAKTSADAPKLIVYSVDHGLRPEAADEVAMVLETAAGLGLAARGLVWSGEKPETGVQEAARVARYRLMGAAMTEDGAEILLTAHHRQDQAETILMRLAHGSGLEGLKGMGRFSRVEGVPLHRPLLGIEPGALRDIVMAAGLTPAEDPSNDDPSYERVRWRQFLPQLAEMGLDSAALAQFGARMADADAAIAQMAEACFGEIVTLDGFGAARIAPEPFAGLGSAIATRLLARVLRIVGGRQKPHALGQVEKLRADIASGGPARAVTVLGCVIRRRDGALVVAREPGRALPPDRALPAGGELLWDGRFRIANGSDDPGLVVSAADYLPRRQLEQFLGFRVTAPAEALRTAPIVRNGAGEVLALGGWSFDTRIGVEFLVD